MTLNFGPIVENRQVETGDGSDVIAPLNDLDLCPHKLRDALETFLDGVVAVTLFASMHDNNRHLVCLELVKGNLQTKVAPDASSKGSLVLISDS